MKKLMFPCGAFYEMKDNATGIKSGPNRLVIFESWQSRIPLPKREDGKLPFCLMCHNRSCKRIRCFIDDTDRLGFYIRCTAKLEKCGRAKP